MESPPWPGAIYLTCYVYGMYSVADGIYIIEYFAGTPCIVDFRDAADYYLPLQGTPWRSGQCAQRAVCWPELSLDDVPIANYSFYDDRYAFIMSSDLMWMVMRPRAFCAVAR